MPCAAQLVAICHILISTTLLAEIVNTADELRDFRNKQMARIAQLERRLDANMMESLVKHAANLRSVGGGGEEHSLEDDGLTEHEFTLAMLVELGIAPWDQIRPFIKQFRNLDITGDGRLSLHDLKINLLSMQQGQSTLGIKYLRLLT